ncbi:hypothetical protein NLJ89_g2942 [Agrocybe chaxingu]|uniref:Uncharacterized protein n=1 Tax=Agrocybe chaxingu TaxID=84603 RepID=A0A9W8K5V8_9AGAR|nr:hypothetical protein NLJ89_g2942 [Agrocybe chaxingu]
MLSNVEQAITNVLAAKQTPDYGNVLREYMNLTGFVPYLDNLASSFFHNAIDKYIGCGERLNSPFAHIISEIRKQEFDLCLLLMQIRLGTELIPCPCCGVCMPGDEIKRKMGFIDDEISLVATKTKKLHSRRFTKTKSRSKKVTGRVVAFDSCGPSTKADIHLAAVPST